LTDAHKPDEALTAARRTVDLYRQLAKAKPTVFEPDLARALGNLGAILSGTGQQKEARIATQEAVDRYRRLDEAEPAVFKPDLARSLSNLGAIMSGKDEREDALKAIQDSVDCYRPLAEANSAFEPDLVRSLVNLCYILDEIGGRYKDEMEARFEAFNRGKRLRAIDPELARQARRMGLTIN
jgi:tetratricopeptide (TPR) repeat protein